MKEKEKWASYGDLLEIKKELLEKAIEKASYYSVTPNFNFEFSSSQSGMYPKWMIRDCGSMMGKGISPIGIGNSVNAALQDFIDKCNKESTDKEKG